MPSHDPTSPPPVAAPRSKKDTGHLKYARLTLPTLSDTDRHLILELVSTGIARATNARYFSTQLSTSITTTTSTNNPPRKLQPAVRPGRPSAINEEAATRLRLALILQPTATAEQLIGLTGCTCSVRTVQRSMGILRAEADLLAEYVMEEYQQDIFELRRWQVGVLGDEDGNVVSGSGVVQGGYSAGHYGGGGGVP